MVAVMFLTAVPFAGFRIKTIAATNGKTQTQAVEWATSKSGGISLDHDGVYGAQCVDLIRYYYSYLGATPVSGSGCDYSKNALPAGWSRIQYYNGFVAQPGDVAVWTYTTSANGHVAIVTSATSSSMSVVEQNGSTGVTRTHSYSYSYGTFWGVIRPDFENYTSPPSKPKLSISQSALGVNQTALLSWNPCENATYYWVSCWSETEQVISQEGFNYSQEISFSKAGKYSLMVVSGNNLGETVSDSIEIVVYDQKPNAPKIEVEKTDLKASEKTTVKWAPCENATYYWVSCWSETEQVISQEGFNYSQEISFSKAGKYSLMIVSGNPCGESISEKIVITVSYPELKAPEIEVDKNILEIGERTTLKWNPCENATYYWISCWSDKEQVISQEGFNYSHELYFSKAGEYSLMVVSGNDYGESVSTPIEITVYNPELKAPEIEVSKSTLAVGEKTILKWSLCKTATYYWVSCWSETEQVISREGFNYSQEISFSEAGKYSLMVVSGNELVESVSTPIEIIVYDKKPNAPKIEIEDNVLTVGEHTIINWEECETATYYWVSCWSETEQVISKETFNHSEDIAFDYPGKYSIMVVAGNAYGETISQPVKVVVYDTFKIKSDSLLIYDDARKIVYGNSILKMSAEELCNSFANSNTIIKTNSGKITTGTTVNLVDETNTIYDVVTIVIFGDVNGDGWYDGQDAVLVSCLANGMLTKEDVGEAVYTAADCNHDGIIDQLDVDLLNQAGTLLAEVDQSKTNEELFETSSIYVEYLDLIDQSPEVESDVNEKPENGTNVPQKSEPSPSNKFVVFILDIIAALKFAFDFIISIFKV